MPLELSAVKILENILNVFIAGNDLMLKITNRRETVIFILIFNVLKP